MEEIRAHKKRRMIIGLSVIGAVIILIAVAVIVHLFTSDDEAASGDYKRVERREIANSIAASGRIVAASSEEVTSTRIAGKVNHVYVSEGDEVSAGQVICTFDTSALSEQLDEAYTNLSEAREDIDKRSDIYKQRIEEAEGERARSIADTANRLDVARVEYLNAYIESSEADNNYRDYLAVSNHHEYDNEAIQLQLIAEARRTNTAYRENVVAYLENTLQGLWDNDTSTIDEARLNFTDSANSTIDSLEDQIREIDRAINESDVRCSVGGTVTRLGVSVGDTYLGGAIAVIEQTGDLLVEAEVGEYDIADVAVGMRTLIKTEATRDEQMEGVVTYVAPKASGSDSGDIGGAITGLIGMDMSSLSSLAGGGSSQATYLVRIALLNPNSRLRLGMNAKLSIITESVEDAVSVPYDAIMISDDGRQYIEVATNYDKNKSDDKGQYETNKVSVTTGIEGSYYIQVFGDVKVGDYVYVPPAEGTDSIDEIMERMGADAGI